MIVAVKGVVLAFCARGPCWGGLPVLCGLYGRPGDASSLQVLGSMLENVVLLVVLARREPFVEGEGRTVVIAVAVAD